MHLKHYLFVEPLALAAIAGYKCVSPKINADPQQKRILNKSEPSINTPTSIPRCSGSIPARFHGVCPESISKKGSQQTHE